MKHLLSIILFFLSFTAKADTARVDSIWRGKLDSLRKAHELETNAATKLRTWMAKKIFGTKQMVLSLHALEDGKFLVDDMALSSEELAQYLAHNGNLSKYNEIVLVSCNDLDAGIALSKYTNKPVYTTDGSLTLYSDGVGDASWYKISPDGSHNIADKLPLKKCVECKDGVEMGKRGSGASSLTQTLSKIDKLTTLTSAEKTALKNLLNENTDLAAKFANNTEEMAGAWKLVRNSISEGTQFAKDPKTLEKLAEMMQTNSAFRQKLGSSWEQELKEILEKNADLRCGTCGNKGIANLPKMDEMLDNLANISQYADKPGFSSVLKNLKSNIANRDGVNHMIGYIKKNADDFKNITEFEFQYADDILNKADVLVGNIKYEFKSWTPDIPNPWNSFFSGTGNSYTQFLRYLQNTSDIKNLKYIFNGAKASESQVKTAFKTLFSNPSKKTEIFNANPELWKQFDRIGGGKIEDIEDFIELLNHQSFNTNHPIFNFIKAQ